MEICKTGDFVFRISPPLEHSATCGPFMLVRCSPTFHLMREYRSMQYRYVYTNHMPCNPSELPRPDLKNLLVFATKGSHFVFDGQYYDQVDAGQCHGLYFGPGFSKYLCVILSRSRLGMEFMV